MDQDDIGSKGCLLFPVLIVVVCLMDKSNREWYSCSVSCEGAAGVCLMDQLFGVTCAGAVRCRFGEQE